MTEMIHFDKHWLDAVVKRARQEENEAGFPLVAGKPRARAVGSKKARAAKSEAARTLYTSISTKTARPVRLVRIFKLEYREGSIIELRAFFSGIWDVERLGLLYGSASWLKSFRAGLQEIGFSPDVARQIDYSEMGMQGIDYVSLDAPDEIVKEWPRVRRALYAREREFAKRLKKWPST